jgi:hypothetical protein
MTPAAAPLVGRGFPAARIPANGPARRVTAGAAMPSALGALARLDAGLSRRIEMMMALLPDRL